MEATNMSLFERIAISELLNEINDKSLQNILRKVIFNNENVLTAIRNERPETIQRGKEYHKYITDKYGVANK